MDDDQAPGWRAYAWGVLAALTCPCHLPILAAVLAGTTAGAFLSEHWGSRRSPWQFCSCWP